MVLRAGTIGGKRMVLKVLLGSGAKAERLELGVELERETAEGRSQFVWTVSHAEAGGELAELERGNDLRSGVGAGADYPAMLGTFLSFLEAAGESYRYHGNRMEAGSNTDLFSEVVCELAYRFADELSMARVELEGDDA